MQEEILGELFSLLQQRRVKNIICSPGSRNAAILMWADRQTALKKHVVVDERSAAFIALGMSMASQEPVALICTSGSALLNYAPALAEAFYQGIPLIVISADRPEEWIDQDDSQTIRQAGALKNFIKAGYDIDAERFESDYLWFANRMFNEGLEKALSGKKGPVHFNIHLSGIVDEPSDHPHYARAITTIKAPSQLSPQEIKVWGDMMAVHKILIVVGFLPPDHRLQKAIASIVTLPNVAVMAETVSNLHLPPECYVIDKVLFPLDREKEDELRPDILISLGGALISRKLKEFLRRNHPRFYHLSFNSSDNIIDCFKSLDYNIECNPSSFFTAVAKRMAKIQKEGYQSPEYRVLWEKLRKDTAGDIKNLPWSDLKALDIILNRLPASSNLFLSNGTAVRYGQIIPYRPTHATYANRGVSGIEGCTSTAVGLSAVYQDMTVLITGDMSFGYDLGGLSSGLESPNMRIVVLDNGGGDIFRFISATNSLPIREEYLCADPEVPVGLLADAYGWIYFHADSESRLLECLDEFFDDSFRAAILHVKTRQVENNSEILSKFLMTPINKTKDNNTNDELGKN